MQIIESMSRHISDKASILESKTLHLKSTTNFTLEALRGRQDIFHSEGKETGHSWNLDSEQGLGSRTWKESCFITIEIEFILVIQESSNVKKQGETVQLILSSLSPHLKFQLKIDQNNNNNNQDTNEGNLQDVMILAKWTCLSSSRVFLIEL